MGRSLIFFSAVLLVSVAQSGQEKTSEITLLPLRSFGQQIQGCRVASFRTSRDNGETSRQYKKNFRGLVGKEIPFGSYDVRVICGKREIFKEVLVDLAKQFETVTLGERQMISDDHKPELIIKLVPPAANNETWWVRLTGLYSAEAYTDHFAGADCTASIVNPEPGSYFVSISNPKGYTCAREIDLTENTKEWTFNPVGCTFRLDRYAHLVSDDDKKNGKKLGWYARMQAVHDQLFRDLEDAAQRKQPPF